MKPSDKTFPLFFLKILSCVTFVVHQHHVVDSFPVFIAQVHTHLIALESYSSCFMVILLTASTCSVIDKLSLPLHFHLLIVSAFTINCLSIHASFFFLFLFLCKAVADVTLNILDSFHLHTLLCVFFVNCTLFKI